MLCSPQREVKWFDPLTEGNICLLRVIPRQSLFCFNVIAFWSLYFIIIPRRPIKNTSRSHQDGAAAARNAEKYLLTFSFRSTSLHPFLGPQM